MDKSDESNTDTEKVIQCSAFKAAGEVHHWDENHGFWRQTDAGEEPD